MPRKLYKINPTTFEANFTRARVEVGDKDKEGFVPACKIYNFDDETYCNVKYNNKRYALLADPEAEELDKVILIEGVEYPPYDIDKPYEVGDLLEYNGGLYEVIQAHTSQEDWIPSENPALYKTSTPPGVIAQWVQPLGSHDAYALDTKVYHQEQVWKSTVADNVWEPGVYGWEESVGGTEIEFYCIDDIGEQNVSGLEFEVILKERPESNVIAMQIESEGLNFYYQPELTQAEIDEGAYRPEEVVGSYAVYHATCGQMHKGQANAEKYQTGKAFHIYRPKVVDVNDDWTWGELSIDAELGILSITVDEEWLDTAVYPVRVDPTFGYVDENGDGIVGGSFVNRSYPFSFSASPASDGIAKSVSAYFLSFNNEAENVKCGLYKDGVQDTDFLAETAVVDFTTATLDGWVVFNFSGTVEVLAASEYAITANPDAQVRTKVDSVTETHYARSAFMYPDWLTLNDEETSAHSIYCTYETIFVLVNEGATDVAHESATLNGDLIVLGKDSANVYFEWKKDGAAEWNSTTPQEMYDVGTFDAQISGLDPDTEYEFRPVGEYDDNGSTETVYGDILTFLTLLTPLDLGLTEVTGAVRLSWSEVE